MTDQDRIAAIETAPSITTARRLALDAPPGFERRLFDELRSRAGHDPARALRLARAGEAFLDGRAAWSHRFRAVAHRFAQRWLASANAYLRAEAASPDPVEGAAMAVGAVDSLARAGRVAQAVRLGSRLSSVLERAGREPEAGRAELNIGNALLWHDRVEEAIPHFERAAALLAEEPIERAGAWLGLSTAQIDFGTAPSVREPAEMAREAFEANGLSHYAAIAGQNLAQADLMSGKLDDAIERLLLLRTAFDRTSEEFARNEQHIGETYLRLNMPVEARQAFQDALACKATARLPFSKAQCHLGLAEAEFALGNHERGEASADRARRLFNRAGNRAGAALAAAVAASATNDVSSLARVVRDLERHNLRRKCAEAMFLLAEHRAFTDAHRRGRELVERHGLIDLEWRMHAASARASRPERRLDAYRRMAQAMWQTRSMHRSTVARQHFLRDKDQALREYLGVLLESGEAEHVEEAVRVLSSARSVSLIDEIVFARGASLTPSQSAALEDLRAEMQADLYGDSQGRARRAAARDVAQWRRAWHEAVGPLLHASEGRRLPPADTVYVEARGSYYRIADGRAARCGDRETIANATDWTAFDLLAPLVTEARGAIEESLAEYAALIGYSPRRDGETIMPDEDLWRAPWPALAPGREPVVSVAPGFHGVYQPRSAPLTVTVWYQPSPRMPHIEQEVNEIRALFGDVRLCRTASEVRDSLRGGAPDLLHVATHAALNVWNPMFSYLKFDDGAVYAAEIARGALRPRLVTMSACDSGSVSTIEANEPDGLVRAALALGSESVVASAWPLDDRASSVFTVPYYRILKDGGSVLEAVAQARGTVRQELPHPYFWGAMVVFGGYLQQ